MLPRRTAAIVLRHFYLMRGSAARILPLFAWVVIDIVLWGFMTRYLNTTATSGVDFVPMLLGAVLLWDFFTRVMYGVTSAFFEDVWSRNFLNLFATPLSVNEYLGGLVFTSTSTSFIGLGAMLVLASAVFGLSISIYGLAVVAFLFVLFLFGIALGIFGSALVLRFGPAAEWFVWPIPALVSPFASVFYPVAILPPWMRGIAYAMPPVYVFEGVRAIVAGGRISPAMLVCGAVLSVAYIVAACLAFSWTFRRAVRTGLIARYSAESAG